MTTSVPDPAAVARSVARAAAAAFGGHPQVSRFYDEDESHSVDILTCADRPVPGLCTYSTVTLHRSINRLDGTDVRTEMVGVARKSATMFANLLATAAFFVAKNGWLRAPGVVFPDLVREYGLSDSMQHILWTPPFAWDELGSVSTTALTCRNGLSAGQGSVCQTC